MGMPLRASESRLVTWLFVRTSSSVFTALHRRGSAQQKVEKILNRLLANRLFVPRTQYGRWTGLYKNTRSYHAPISIREFVYTPVEERYTVQSTKNADEPAIIAMHLKCSQVAFRQSAANEAGHGRRIVRQPRLASESRSLDGSTPRVNMERSNDVGRRGRSPKRTASWRS